LKAAYTSDLPRCKKLHKDTMDSGEF